MNRRMWTITIVLVAIVVLGTLAFMYLGHFGANPPANAPTPPTP
jgi:hypothetical protein